MPTSPPTLTAAPTSPDRADRATFAARAVALDDWTKNTHVPQLQTAINGVYSNSVEVAANATIAADSVALAAASANYKGEWSTLSGALNKPASASHGGTIWILGSNVANVAAEVPGTSAAWVPLIMGTIPQLSKSIAYTMVTTDAGKHILHPSADTTARVFTIPANASVPYPIGTVITIINQSGAGVVTLAVTSDVMRWSPTGTTGSRNIAANGLATVVKLTATEWIVNGMGLS